MTDIERLHEVIAGNLDGRGQGKTYALCMQIIGHIQVGQFEEIAIGLAHMRHMHQFQQMLFPLLEDHDIWRTKERNAGLTVVWTVGSFADPDAILNMDDTLEVRFTKLVFMPVLHKKEWVTGRPGDYIYMEDHYARIGA